MEQLLVNNKEKSLEKETLKEMAVGSPSIQQKSTSDSSGINEKVKGGYFPLIQEPDS